MKTFRWVDVATYDFFPAVTLLASVMFNDDRSVDHEKLSKLPIFSLFSNTEINFYHATTYFFIATSSVTTHLNKCF